MGVNQPGADFDDLPEEGFDAGNRKCTNSMYSIGTDRPTDRNTDRQNDRQTDRQTTAIII